MTGKVSTPALQENLFTAEIAESAEIGDGEAGLEQKPNPFASSAIFALSLHSAKRRRRLARTEE